MTCRRCGIPLVPTRFGLGHTQPTAFRHYPRLPSPTSAPGCDGHGAEADGAPTVTGGIPVTRVRRSEPVKAG